MRVNKFNIDWQIARTKARKIKDVDQKIKFVISFLDNNKCIQNHHRVMNWLEMTSLAYKDDVIRNKFANAVAELDENICAPNDIETPIEDVPINDLVEIHKDLSSRKYNFMFKRIPMDHIKFMMRLEMCIYGKI